LGQTQLIELANLAGQLEHYRLVVGNQEQLGDVGRRCTQFSVMGGDSGSRDALAIVGRGAGSLQSRMPVLTPAGVIGRVQRVGVTGAAHVLLLTDKQSTFTGSFGRYVDHESGKPVFQTLKLEPSLIDGVGGAMRSDKLPLKQVEAAGMQQGDILVLDDPSWPDALRWRRVGRVAHVGPSKKNVLFAEIEIEPVVNASQLREVMVMNK
jgi:hypothetical protein